MDYFDVRHVPDGFLRAQFRSHSVEDTQTLATAFSPVASALLKTAEPGTPIRIGIQGISNLGKTEFSKTLITSTADFRHDHSLIRGWSNVYTLPGTDNIIHHYDNAGFQYQYYDGVEAIPLEKLTEFQREEYEMHQEIKLRAIGHVSEWPQRDIDHSFSMLWDFKSSAFPDGNGFIDQIKAHFVNSKKIEKAHRNIAFYCPDGIAEMPEFQAFMHDDSIQHLRAA